MKLPHTSVAALFSNDLCANTLDAGISGSQLLRYSVSSPGISMCVIFSWYLGDISA